MRNKILSVAAICSLFFMTKCSTNTQPENTAPKAEIKKDTVSNGIGPFKEVALTHPLDAGMVDKGENIYNH